MEKKLETSFDILGRIFLGGTSKAWSELLIKMKGHFDEDMMKRLRTISSGQNISAEDWCNSEYLRIFGGNIPNDVRVYLSPEGIIDESVFSNLRYDYNQGHYPIDSGELLGNIGQLILCFNQLGTSSAKMKFFYKYLAPVIGPFTRILCHLDHALFTPAAYELLNSAQQFIYYTKEKCFDLNFGNVEIPSYDWELFSEETGLFELAQFLVTPVYSGMVVTNEMIRSWAHECLVPYSNNSKTKSLSDLFFEALEYEKFSDLIHCLVRDYSLCLKECRERPTDMLAFFAPWGDKCEETITHLQNVLVEVESRDVSRIDTHV
jgi:hypothetical protein